VRELLDCLKSGTVLVADGAMGTMLQERGLKIGDCPERMNLDRPDVLTRIAHLYLEAGADIIHTNTFGASPLRLVPYALDDRTERINAAAVQAARAAVGDKDYLSASCGPSGTLLKPHGDTDPETVSESFARQISALAEAGIDMITVETMTDLSEAVLAVKAAKSIAPSTPVAATMTFDATPRGFYTIMGVSVEQAVEGLAEAGADIIGSNCGNGIRNMVRIAEEFRKHTSLPLLIQSNAGLPLIQEGRVVYPETPEFMADEAQKLLAAGVNIIGGCCGTTPEHTAAIRKIVDACRA